MSSSEQCNLCRLPGGSCPRHATDLNYPLGGVQDDSPFSDDGDGYGFVSHGIEFPWFANGSSHRETPPVRPGFGFSDLLRSTCDPSRIPFDLGWSSSDGRSSSWQLSAEEPPVNVSNSKVTFPWTTFTSNSSEEAKEAGSGSNGELQAPVDTSMDREARVQRYKEKKKRRKFEKQIRYASRKAYAEMRPRVKGRFAKATDAGQASAAAASYNPSHFDIGWYHP